MEDNTLKITGSTYLRLARPIYRSFKPLPDITAYELALLLPYLICTDLYDEDLQKLGTAARHLEE